MAKGNKSAVVKGAKGHSFDWKCTGSAHDWEVKGKKQEAAWLSVDDTQLKKAQKVVQETKLVWGTIWEPALEMALAMDPPPQVIYFMTDGSAGPDSDRTASRVGLKARSQGIVINTVALMEPKAQKAMLDLANRTNGQMIIVDQGGKVRKMR